MREEYSYHFTRHDGDTKVVKRKEVKTLIEPYILNIMNYVIVDHKAEQQSKRVEIIHTILFH